MDASFDLDAIRLFLLFVLPGLISMHVYRLIMPASSINWSTAILEGLFYSSINFAILFPLIVFIHHNQFLANHPIWYGIIGMGILFVGPIIWPLVYRKIIRSKKLMKGLQLPYPTAWDYFFDFRIPVFVLVHLKNGKMIGGYFGANSYATAFPKDGDIYIETVYKVNDDGIFDTSIELSRGLLIRKEEYTHIELFDIPSQNE